MKTARDIANALINKAKRMQEFRIMRPMPEDFEFRGQVPFDVKIKEGMMTFTVHALTIEDAKQQVENYINESTY